MAMPQIQDDSYQLFVQFSRMENACENAVFLLPIAYTYGKVSSFSLDNLFTAIPIASGAVSFQVTFAFQAVSLVVNAGLTVAPGCRPFILPDHQLRSQMVSAAPRGRPAAGLSVANRMPRTLRIRHGRLRHVRRKAIVEPVFSQIKQGRGYRQFLLRGRRQVQGERTLICTTHNT